jgi:hypothetical protein
MQCNINYEAVFGCKQARRQERTWTSGGTFHAILASELNARRAVSVKPRPLLLRGKSTGTNWIWQVWPRAWIVAVKKRKKLMTLLGIDPDPSVVQPLAWSLHRLSYPGSAYLKLSSFRITCTGPKPIKLDGQLKTEALVFHCHRMLRRRLVHNDVMKDRSTFIRIFKQSCVECVTMIKDYNPSKHRYLSDNTA